MFDDTTMAGPLCLAREDGYYLRIVWEFGLEGAGDHVFHGFVRLGNKVRGCIIQCQ